MDAYTAAALITLQAPQFDLAGSALPNAPVVDDGPTPPHPHGGIARPGRRLPGARGQDPHGGACLRARAASPDARSEPRPVASGDTPAG